VIEQHALLERIAALVDAGTVRTTVGEHFGTISAANLRKAHGLIESGRARGKIVLEGFAPWLGGAGPRGARRRMSSAMELTRKVALVTGAARGIGRAIAVALARAGCDVVVSDVARPGDGVTPYRLSSGEDLATTVAAVEAAGRRSAAVPADVTVAAEVELLMAEVASRFGGLDVLVANAGIIAAAPVAAMDEATWDRIFAVNVKGVFLCARAAIPLLIARGGRIVNIASVAGKTGRGGLSAYCASKSAVISLTQALAEELGPMNVAVNALCPGYIQTAMWTEVLNPVLAGMTGVPVERVFEDFVQRSTYLKREQTPEEIADAAVYLCRAENVTGITLTVAGGGEVH
jgi:meso-butanediol dehydrogenase / (S,S)-butanediol dehydrogenase / diacetyl reductase